MDVQDRVRYILTLIEEDKYGTALVRAVEMKEQGAADRFDRDERDALESLISSLKNYADADSYESDRILTSLDLGPETTFELFISQNASTLRRQVFG